MMVRLVDETSQPMQQSARHAKLAQSTFQLVTFLVPSTRLREESGGSRSRAADEVDIGEHATNGRKNMLFMPIPFPFRRAALTRRCRRSSRACSSTSSR